MENSGRSTIFSVTLESVGFCHVFGHILGIFHNSRWLGGHTSQGNFRNSALFYIRRDPSTNVDKWGAPII